MPTRRAAAVALRIKKMALVETVDDHKSRDISRTRNFSRTKFGTIVADTLEIILKLCIGLCREEPGHTDMEDRN